MGRQINFFMFGDDEYKFMKYVLESNDYIIDSFGNALCKELDKLPSFFATGTSIAKYYIAAQGSKIEIRKGAGLEPAISDVIEFKRSIIRHGNEIWNGRIWVETKYYNGDRETVMKPKWLIEKFDLYQKWIKKNMQPNKDKDFYVGDEAYKQNKGKGYKLMNSPKLEIYFCRINYSYLTKERCCEIFYGGNWT